MRPLKAFLPHIRPSLYPWLAFFTEDHAISESCWSWASRSVACGIYHEEGHSEILTSLRKPLNIPYPFFPGSIFSRRIFTIPWWIISSPWCMLGPMKFGWCYLIPPPPAQPLDPFLQKNLIKRIDPVPFLCVQWSANTTSCVSAFLFAISSSYFNLHFFFPLLFLKILLTSSSQVRSAFYPFPVPSSSASRMACEITWDDHVFLHVFEPFPVAFTSVVRGVSHF